MARPEQGDHYSNEDLKGRDAAIDKAASMRQIFKEHRQNLLSQEAE